MSELLNIDGFVLTGGASSRMGRDKSRIVFGRETLAERAVRTLRDVCSRVATVGGSEIPGTLAVNDVDFCTRGNRHAAIFGVHSALAHSKTEWTAIVACDLPFITPELFYLLFSKVPETGNAIVPIQPDGNLQPLCALYRTKPCLVSVVEAVENGELSMQKFLDRIDAINLDFKEIDQLKNAEKLFINVNTAEVLELACNIARRFSSEQFGKND